MRSATVRRGRAPASCPGAIGRRGQSLARRRLPVIRVPPFCGPDAAAAGGSSKMRIYTEKDLGWRYRASARSAQCVSLYQLWGMVVLLLLALALPLRAQAGRLDSCCVAGMAGMPVHEAQASDATGSPHDYAVQSSCAGDRHASGPSRVSCMSSTCAVFAGTSLATDSATDAWTSVLVAHPEFAYPSVVPPRLDRPPKRVRL